MTDNFQTLIASGSNLRFGDPQAALAAFEAAYALARNDGHSPRQAEAAIGAGQMHRDLGNLSVAAACYIEAVTCLRASRDETRLASALRHLGDIYLDAGDTAEARPPLEEALDIYRRHPETSDLSLANALRPLALLAEAEGKPDRGLWQQARNLYARAGVEAGVAECDANLES